MRASSGIYMVGESSDLATTDKYLSFRIFSNILECNMCNRVYKYLQENRILYFHQFGFQVRHSTEHAIIQLSDKLSENFEENKYISRVFVNFSISFHTVNHKIVLN